MKFFVVSDVHSYYYELMQALNKAGFDENDKSHIFVSCGDLLDRGPDAKKCLEFVNNLNDDRKILIKGNHEQLLEDIIHRGYFLSHDYHNKTHETVYQLTGIHPTDNIPSIYSVDRAAILDMLVNKDWDKYRTKLINYYETDKYVFVHGWIPFIIRFIDSDNGKIESVRCYTESWRNEDSDWESARWANGMDAWKDGIREPGKTIVCGHWHSSWGHCNIHHNGVEFSETTANIPSIHTPFYDDGIIALDACTAYSGFVNCVVLDIEDK